MFGLTHHVLWVCVCWSEVARTSPALSLRNTPSKPIPERGRLHIRIAKDFEAGKNLAGEGSVLFEF
jgi:hypothetical protein